jgi:N-acetylglucosaminyldiphosphoundecaprenol N-acetyl-beta-D-mannosaminyltransferase
MTVCGSARTPVLGVGVSAVSLESAAAEILAWVNDWHRGSRTSRYVAVTGVHGLIEAQDDPSFKQILNRSGLTVPDGMPLVWLSWLAGRQDVTRVYGPDLTLRVSSALASAGYSSFYYGGAPGVADELAARMNRRFPGLRCAGTLSPPYRSLTEDEEEDIVRTISSSGADVVWVGLSTPKQERWMARLQDRLETPVLIGVGAAFDFLTDRIPQAPGWMQKSGLEWLFRLGAEPRRLWKRYLRNNPLFLYYLACEKIGLRDFS